MKRTLTLLCIALCLLAAYLLAIGKLSSPVSIPEEQPSSSNDLLPSAETPEPACDPETDYPDWEFYEIVAEDAVRTSTLSDIISRWKYEPTEIEFPDSGEIIGDAFPENVPTREELFERRHGGT